MKLQTTLFYLAAFSIGTIASAQEARDHSVMGPRGVIPAAGPMTQAGIDRVSDILSLEPTERAPVDVVFEHPHAIRPLAYQRPTTFKPVDLASDRFMHRGLVFEERDLERYGAAKPEARQLMVSGARFFGRGFVAPVTLMLPRNWRQRPSTPEP